MKPAIAPIGLDYLADSIVAAGHSHLDVAWMWTLGQTRRKAGRTFLGFRIVLL